MAQRVERNNLLDLMKGVGCIMVVLLHFPTDRFGDGFYCLEMVLGRCGVPLFLMISGYLAGQKILYGQKEIDAGKWFLRQCRKIMTYFLVFSLMIYVFYRVFDLITRAGSPTLTVTPISVRSILRLIFGSEPLFSGYLWYLPAYGECLLVFFVLSRFGEKGYALAGICTPLLLICYHVLGRYSQVFLHRDLPEYFARNFIFAAVPMFCLGFYLPRFRAASSRANQLLLLGASFFALVCEYQAFAARPDLNPGRNNYFFNLIAAFLLVQLVTVFPWRVSDENYLVRIGRKYSLYIYVFQFVAGVLWNRAFLSLFRKFSGGTVFIAMYRYGKPLVIFLTALAIGAVLHRVEKQITLLFSRTV